MNREIKFRAAHYDFNDKFVCFTYWGRIDHKRNCIDNNSCFMSPASSFGTRIKKEEQYTGLKDKNGVEIFEGDILESYVDPSVKIKHIVQWSEKHLGWFAKNIENISENKSCPGDIQLWVYITNAKLSAGDKIYHVVGNIHEEKP